jgi:hypothetical protein
MGFRFPKYTLFAKLGADDVAVLCGRAEAYKWLRSDIKEGGKRIHIDVAGWHVHTQFKHYSSEPDIPMFWEVNWFRVRPFQIGQLRFGTKEQALEYHERLVSLFSSKWHSIEELAEMAYEADLMETDEQDEADWWKDRV